MIEISFRHGRWYGMCHHQTPSAAQKIVKLESLVGSDPDVPDRDPTLCSQHIVRKTNSPETTNQRIHGTTTLASSNRRQGRAGLPGPAESIPWSVHVVRVQTVPCGRQNGIVAHSTNR